MCSFPVPVYAMNVYSCSRCIFNLVPDRGEWSASRPGLFTPQ
jgi:hypothetical protein